MSAVHMCHSLSHIIVVTYMLPVVLLTGATHACQHTTYAAGMLRLHMWPHVTPACVIMCSGCMQVGSNFNIPNPRSVVKLLSFYRRFTPSGGPTCRSDNGVAVEYRQHDAVEGWMQQVIRAACARQQML